MPIPFSMKLKANMRCPLSLLLLASAFYTVRASPDRRDRDRDRCQTDALYASFFDDRWNGIAHSFCSGYGQSTVFAVETVTKKQEAVVTLTHTTCFDTVYTRAGTTITDQTSIVLTTVATALETITTSTATETTTTSTESDSTIVSTAIETSTASTETDSATISTDFLTVYSPTVTDTATVTSVSYVPRLKGRDFQPPGCWIQQYPPSRLSSACGCIGNHPAPTKTVYTETTVVTTTISKTRNVGALSIVEDTIVFTKSVEEVTTVPVTSTSVIDVGATTVLGAVATTVIPATVTSVDDVTTTSIVDIVETSTFDVTQTVTSSTTTVNTVQCTDPVVNGGFDTGSISPWQTRGQGESFTFVSPGHDSSAYALQITFTGNTGGILVLDESPVVCPGVTYDYSVWVNNVSPNIEEQFALVNVNVFLSGSYYSSTGGTATIIGPGWQKVSGSFSSVFPNIGLEVSVEFEPNNPGDTGVVLLDDIVFAAT